MKKITVFTIVSFIVFNINAQSARLDSMISYLDTLSEMPYTKCIYQYNDEGKSTATIKWNTVTSNGIVEYKEIQIDSFYYNEQGFLSRISGYSLINGTYVETSRTLLEYDNDGNNTIFISQGKIFNGPEWVGIWLWENTYENGLLSDQKLSSKNFSTEMWSPLYLEEYSYDSITGLKVQENSFNYDDQTGEEEPSNRTNFFYDKNGYLERSEGHKYNFDSSSFELTSIRNYTMDDFGNNLLSLNNKIDSNGEETLSSRSRSTYNTNIERSQAYLPINIIAQISNTKHIILDRTSESWENEEWQVSSKAIYYYSGLTKTEDLLNVEELKIFPNPSNSMVYFNNHEALKGTNSIIQIFQSDGRLIFTGRLNENKFDVQNFQSGLYSILVRNDKSLFSGKFIKL